MLKIIYYGLSGNPVTLAHQRIVKTLAGMCTQLNVAICGSRDKESSKLLAPEDRAALAVLGFPDLPDNVDLNLADLGRMGQNKRRSTYAQLNALRDRSPSTKIFLAVGADLVFGGRDGNSEIQQKWICGNLLWEEFGFYIFSRFGIELVDEDLPPKGQRLLFKAMTESSTNARKAAARGDRDALIKHVNVPMADFILSRGLYRAS